MHFSTVARPFFRTVQLGTVLVLFAVVIGCSEQGDSEKVDSKSTKTIDTAATADDPPSAPTDVTLPDPDAEEMVSAEKWYTDFDKAQAAARKDGKDMFIEFTGLSWCPPCIQFHETILRYQNFSDYANQRFVLLKLDFPQGSDPTPERMAQSKLAEKYGITGFPTILLADSKARVYSQFGFEPRSIRAFAEFLEEQIVIRQERDRMFAEAAKLEGVEKAKKIEETILQVGREFMMHSYGAELADIIELDKDNKAGLNKKYSALLEEHEFAMANLDLQTKIDMIEDYEEKLAAIESVEKKFANYDRGLLQLSMFKSYVYKNHNKTDELLKLSETMFANKDLDDETKLQLRMWRMRALSESKRFDEAEKELDAISESDKKNESLQMNVILLRAKNQTDQGNKAEARKLFDSALKTASDPRRRAQIGRLREEILGPDEPLKVEEKKDADKKDGDKKGEETPKDKKPAEEKPGEEKTDDSAKEAVKPDAKDAKKEDAEAKK
jgi:thiol-disulfide isomerase/thioredoxin